MTLTDSKLLREAVEESDEAVQAAPKDFIKTPDGWAGLLEDICARSTNSSSIVSSAIQPARGSRPVPPPARR
jgi:hypothetical protein